MMMEEANEYMAAGGWAEEAVYSRLRVSEQGLPCNRLAGGVAWVPGVGGSPCQAVL